MIDRDRMAQDYRTAFLRYLPHRSEAAVTAGYELGRQAATNGAGLLDLVQVHHRILTEVLVERPAEVREVTEAAADFLSEVLSTFDMAHRVLHHPPGDEANPT